MADVDMTLLVLPEEVMYRYVFPYLELNELLRLRRVCSNTKVYSDGYIRNHFTSYEREINETDHTFAEFIRRDLPTSKIYLNNTGPEFFEDPNIPKFLQLYADKITHLRVQYFSTCIAPSENAFFTALKNLEHLEIHFTDARGTECSKPCKIVNGKKVPYHTIYYPPNFANLKTLKFHDFKRKEAFDFCYYWDFVKFCPHLEHLKHPKFLDIMDGVACGENGPFGYIIQYIEERQAKNSEIPLALKNFDLEHHEEVGIHAYDYCKLSERCYENNVKLMNVDSELMDLVDEGWRDILNEILEPLVSIRNLPGSLFMDELPNLEKVVITSTRKCEYGEFWEDDQPQWPNLRELDINIDSNETRDSRHKCDSSPLEELMNFLFADVERQNMNKLSIRFDCNQSYKSFRRQLPVPRVLDIVKSCSNLTSLALQNWIGTNKAVSRFWDGLPFLEEVSLVACKTLGDVAFVGKNREEPGFLKLAKLRKFSLSKLDQMPKLTDLVFHLVFKNLKIKEFYLTSDSPVKSVTIRGIQALNTGIFNTYVEKFPFQNWSMENVHEEEFFSLGKEFRASSML